jgi:hypothetical protein
MPTAQGHPELPVLVCMRMLRGSVCRGVDAGVCVKARKYQRYGGPEGNHIPAATGHILPQAHCVDLCLKVWEFPVRY